MGSYFILMKALHGDECGDVNSTRNMRGWGKKTGGTLLQAHLPPRESTTTVPPEGTPPRTLETAAPTSQPPDPSYRPLKWLERC
mmetsp:Transcript_33053/g.59184  ORF Transcript_33053/g.59184 Transcript_33053/m.59184 type:complete len:84 (+) Transcript_33053:1258-1509(+)